MSDEPRYIDIDGRNYAIGFQQRIVANQRNILATAYDSAGMAVARQEVSTASARPFLKRDTNLSPPTWAELEDVAVQFLTLEIQN